MVRRRVLHRGAMDCVGQYGGLARAGDGVGIRGVGDGNVIIGVGWEEGRGKMVR